MFPFGKENKYFVSLETMGGLTGWLPEKNLV